MTTARLRLLLFGVSAAVFLAWIGWLGYLAATTRNPVVLSRPQLLASNVDVIAHVEALNKPVEVKEVLWSKDPDAKDLGGKAVTVANLPACKESWKGPGDYLLPLVRTAQPDGGEKFEVAVPPARSPGIDPTLPPRIYPDTPDAREQLRQFRNP
jgi:hypothetical protein